VSPVAVHVLAANVVRAHLIHGLAALAFLVVAIAVGAIADARQRRSDASPPARRRPG
jgi:hypothetical protein